MTEEYREGQDLGSLYQPCTENGHGATLMF